MEGGSLTALEVRVRFLQLRARSVGELTPPRTNLRPGEVPEFRLVARLSVDGQVYQPWQEAVEREVIFPVNNAGALAQSPKSHAFAFPAAKNVEYLRDGELIVGILIRQQHYVDGVVEVSSERLGNELFKVNVRIQNRTPFAVDDALPGKREDALLHSMVSTHTLLGVHAGRFVSLLDPPQSVLEAATNCKNAGTWPVLVGDHGQCDTILSSPIILYDYPQIAPESAGDLFDGTEIDEILSLRIMTLTDDEKREMRQSDERARQMLQRTETMPVEQWMKLHGALRELRPLKEESE